MLKAHRGRAMVPCTAGMLRSNYISNLPKAVFKLELYRSYIVIFDARGPWMLFLFSKDAMRVEHKD